MNYLRTTWLHLQREIRLELRSRDALLGMAFFTLLIVVVFSLAFDPTSQPTLARQIAGGLLWTGLLFASTTALNQSWSREMRNGVLDAQRMSPSAPSALFLGKAIANFLFLTVIEAILAPIFFLFFNLHILGQASALLLLLPLGTWAITVNGTFFAALGLRSRSRELLLPLILFPIALPALLAMIQAATGILTGDAEPTTGLRILAAYDAAYTTVSLLLFDSILSAE
ncbi:heme exporter protein CcmB [Terriglobus tenax]|uniref:heme exporter protein CcmB n=1 Tax=Terriglobus tenax TaxID=1111115 RepID=UPI0021DFDE32|nr:heme exporter protein CcmB [Terriglobus tenax]